jgi:NADH:quinone reductase (non-electrogenic)
MEVNLPSIEGVNAVSHRWRVIIVGGGFGGLRAAQALKSAPVEVTLLHRRNYHLFQPLLYQVATGSLSPGEIAAPLRSVLSRQHNTRVLLGEVVDLDPLSKRVRLADGASFDYDSLIVAAGSQTSYYGHDAWREWAPGLKSVEEATNIRHKILYAFEVAERLADPVQRRAWLTFVVVGAGTTGVELAGAIGEIARQTLTHDFRSIRPEEAEIMLIDGAPRVLMPFPEDLAQKAARALATQGGHGGHWPMGGGGQHLRPPYIGAAGLARLGVHPSNVHRPIPESRAGVHPVGHPGSDVQSRGTTDYRPRGDGFRFQ